MRKISLDEIAAATKIGTRHLRALEDEDFKKLPGGIFNKGFVRSYARFLGINEDQAVSDYLAAAGEPENKTTEIIADQLVAKHEAEKKVKAHSRELETINRNENGIPWGAIAGLVLVVVAAAAGWTYYSQYKARVEAQRQQQESQTAQVQNAPVTTPANDTSSAAGAAQATVETPAPMNAQPSVATPAGNGAPATTSLPAAQQSPSRTVMENPSPEGQPQPETGQGFVVSIRATKRAWISVTADGKHVMSLELTPADSKDIRAHSSVLVRTGNAGGVEISFNGRLVPPLGGEGEVRSATFTPQGIQQ